MLFIFVSLWTTAVPLFAGGRNDKNLSAADELIAQGKLNEALRFLEAYTTAHPDDFDNVQKRIDRIFRLRKEYKKFAEELIKTIEKEPLNDEKKLNLIAQLESYEKDPTETEQAFIRETKFAAQFTYYRAMFENIMAEGIKLNEDARFADSIRRFSDGFVLYKNDFYDDFEGTELLNQVDLSVEGLYTALADYNALQSSWDAAFKKFNKALAEFDIDDSFSAYKEVEAVLQKHAVLRNTFAETGFRFRDFFRELQEKDSQLTDASFLPFAYRFLLGRETNQSMGIVWGMDRQWEVHCAESRTLLAAMIEHLSSEAASRLTMRQSMRGTFVFSDTFRLLRNIKDIDDLGISFIGLYQAADHPARSLPRDFFDAYNTGLTYNKLLVADAVSLHEETEKFKAEKQMFEKLAVPPLQQLSTNEGAIPYSESVMDYAQKRFSGAQSAAERITFLANAKRNMAASAAADSVQPVFTWESLYTTLEKELHSFAAEQAAEGTRSWEALSSFVAASSGILKERYDESYEKHSLLLNEADSSGPSYPDKALKSFTQLKADLTKDIAALQVRFSWLDRAPESPLRENPGSDLFNENYARIIADTAYLKSLSLSIDERNKAAQKYVFLAQQAKNEADFRYEKALAELQRENFDNSREDLQIARNKYNEYLMYQEDDAVRRETDKKLEALGLEIVRLENKRVVQDVRLLLTEARTLYYSGDFEVAERLIIQAEGRWAVTNVEPNVEVSNLKTMIGNALSVRTGRTIPVTDPLYPEMSQTLNAAYQYFEQGKNLLKTGSRDEAMNNLNAAREKIKDIQVLYPLNQEANLLALRIAQLSDPAGFAELFKQRYNNALKEYRQPATVNRAYADLKDLYEINPSYPGLKKRIYDVEVELGIIVPPPTPRQIARSKQLVAEASALFESASRNELALNSALAKLADAISLNPQNSDAMVLIDRIKTSMGGQSLVVLTAEKELLYQQAVQELAKGNTITAAALVADLWKDTKLRNSAKIIDLKRKVDSLL